MFHMNLAPGDIHRPHQWEPANAAALAALSGQVAADIGKLALQLDTKDFYYLTSIGPNVWKKLTALTDRRTLTTVTSSAGVLTLDYSLGDYFRCILTENITSLVISNTAVNIGMSVWLEIVQHASAAKTFAFPASFKWEGGTVPAISTALSARDVLAFTSIDNGTKWDATLSKARS